MVVLSAQQSHLRREESTLGATLRMRVVHKILHKLEQVGLASF